MSYVQAKCENCGGILAVDSEQKAAICPFCQTPYVVQDAINNYNYIVNNNTNINADNVNLYTQKDFLIKGGVLTSYNGENIVVEIPSSVVEIGEKAFARTAIKEVTIPSSVVKIKDGAFSYCSSLKRVNISVGLKQIGRRAFGWCSSLSEIEIPESVGIIEESAFSSCKGLMKVGLKQGLKTIENYAFSDCSNLKELSLPIGLESFSLGAIDGSGIRTISFPTTVVNSPFVNYWPENIMRINMSRNTAISILKNDNWLFIKKPVGLRIAHPFDLIFVEGISIYSFFKVIIQPYSCSEDSIFLNHQILFDNIIITEEVVEYYKSYFKKSYLNSTSSLSLFHRFSECGNEKLKLLDDYAFYEKRNELINIMSRNECIFCGYKNSILSPSYAKCKGCGRMRLISVKEKKY